MYERLDAIAKRFDDLERFLADPAIISDQARFQSMAKELASLQETVKTYRTFQALLKEEEETKRLAQNKDDFEMGKLYAEELTTLSQRKAILERRLEDLLLAGEGAGQEDKTVIVEIRAGTGGDEAALFVADLFRMYSRYASRRALTIDVMSSSRTGIGGFKEMIFEVSGPKAYKFFKFESGVHRVQRVPATEASGRIHTSAVTVAVLPEADEVEVVINPTEIRVDVFRSGGPGGQSVNTTDSAVRVTHLPTGLVVSCQDEKSQHKNKAKALKILRARLFDFHQNAAAAERSSARREMVKTGDRSEKIRTYNFPDRRVTDHRIKLTLHNLEETLDGDIIPFVDALEETERSERLSKGTSIDK